MARIHPPESPHEREQSVGSPRGGELRRGQGCHLLTEDHARRVARVSYDAPIHSVDDIAAAALPARTVNIKPSRAGGLRPLFALYAHCEANGLRMYGGGMGELGVGRGQVQLLASLFHADSPNDVAPSGYNATDPPEDLPPSPLAPPTEPTGFRWAA